MWGTVANLASHLTRLSWRGVVAQFKKPYLVKLERFPPDTEVTVSLRAAKVG
jgi:hypothetical protein